MAAVYWLTETGEVEPQQVCSVDFSDEGEAVEFAHQLYRSVHGFACRRQGFTIRDEDGSALYTWRWTSASGAAPAAEEAGTSAPPRRKPLSTPRYGHAASFYRLVGDAAATLGPVRMRFAGLLSAVARLRPRHRRGEAADVVKALAARLAVITRHISTAWRRLTRWERPVETGAPSPVPSNVRPKAERLKSIAPADRPA